MQAESETLENHSRREHPETGYVEIKASLSEREEDEQPGYARRCQYPLCPKISVDVCIRQFEVICEKLINENIITISIPNEVDNKIRSRIEQFI